MPKKLIFIFKWCAGPLTALDLSAIFCWNSFNCLRSSACVVSLVMMRKTQWQSDIIYSLELSVSFTVTVQNNDMVQVGGFTCWTYCQITDIFSGYAATLPEITCSFPFWKQYLPVAGQCNCSFGATQKNGFAGKRKLHFYLLQRRGIGSVYRFAYLAMLDLAFSAVLEAFTILDITIYPVQHP